MSSGCNEALYSLRAKLNARLVQLAAVWQRMLLIGKVFGSLGDYLHKQSLLGHDAFFFIVGPHLEVCHTKGNKSFRYKVGEQTNNLARSRYFLYIKYEIKNIHIVTPTTQEQTLFPPPHPLSCLSTRIKTQQHQPLCLSSTDQVLQDVCVIAGFVRDKQTDATNDPY